MTIKTPSQLFINELSDTYNAEKQLVKALPKMAKAASDPALKRGFESHLEETKEHVARIERVFELCDEKDQKEKCDAMEGLVKEGEEAIKHVEEGPVRDVALIAAAQKVEHYEIASYGCLCAMAKGLGLTEAATILAQTLEEEKATDQKLTQLAEQTVNQRAMSKAA